MLVETQRLDVLSDGRAAVRISAGEPAEEDVVCAGCGYGVGARPVLPTCPMCRGVVWQPRRLASSSARRHPSR